MKPLPLILIVLLCSVAASAATSTMLSGPAEVSADASTALDSELAGLQRRLADLEDQQARLAENVRDCVSRLEASDLGSGARVAVGDIRAAVDGWMRENMAGASAVVTDLAPASASEGPTPEDAWQELMEGDLSEGEREEYWQMLRDRGLLDEVIAVFEERAEADPGNPDRQVELGHAYVAKIMEVGSGPLAGVWATKADKAFDDALALDDRHWEARYSKAVGLSFWPPIFGKQNEAIRNFEILVEQQAGMPGNEYYASTHLLLGNMYQQIGETEQARAAWQAGLDLYPDDENLREQLDSSQR